MTIADLLEAVHLRYEKNTDYPVAGSEDHSVRLAYANDGIRTWEKETQEGVLWSELKAAASIAAGGTGTDALPTDFRAFLPSDGYPVVIQANGKDYRQVSAGDGNLLVQLGNDSGDVFFTEGWSIRTIPAATGTITFPYLRKATTYATGTEEDEIDMAEPMFLQEYVIAQLYLDDGNMNKYNAHVNNAADMLGAMRIPAITKTQSTNTFGIGM